MMEQHCKATHLVSTKICICDEINPPNLDKQNQNDLIRLHSSLQLTTAM